MPYIVGRGMVLAFVSAMKKNFFIIAAILFSCFTKAQVEGFHVGGRLGLGESTMTGSGMNVESRLAVAGGVTANYQFTNYFGLNADFLLTSTGAKAKGTARTPGLFGTESDYSYNERFDLLNAEVPLMAQLSASFGNFITRIYAGPAMNVNLLATHSRIYDNNDYNNDHGITNQRLDNFKNVSYAMAYGIGIGALAKNNQLFFLDLRFTNGFTAMGRINNSDVTIQYYCLSAGYLF